MDDDTRETVHRQVSPRCDRIIYGCSAGSWCPVTDPCYMHSNLVTMGICGNAKKSIIENINWDTVLDDECSCKTTENHNHLLIAGPSQVVFYCTGCKQVIKRNYPLVITYS